MKGRLEALAARRQALVARSDALRETLEQSAGSLKGTFRFFDIGFAVGRAFGRQPVLLLGLAGAVILLRPRRVLSGLSIALTAVSIYQRLRRALPPGRAARG